MDTARFLTYLDWRRKVNLGTGRRSTIPAFQVQADDAEGMVTKQYQTKIMFDTNTDPLKNILTRFSVFNGRLTCEPLRERSSN